jgi:hypothetical protein
VRVLYVDANVWHINQTANLLPVLFRECFSSSLFYGPGFVDDSQLEGGILHYAERHGPFDVVVLGPATPFLGDDDNLDRNALAFLNRYSCHRLADRCLLNFFFDVRSNFDKLPSAIRLISVLNFDYYAVTQRQVDSLLQKSIGILGPNDQFVSPLSALPGYARHEKHYVRKSRLLTDAWRNFLLEYPERVVTATHFVGPHEYSFHPLSGRPYQVAVPGVEYFLRKDATRQFARTRLIRAPKNYYHFYRFANRLGLPSYSHPLALRLYNVFFQRTLSDTRFVYTARGAFGIPIRKFFEIPAAGALLFCEPCIGYEDLGFEAGRHYIYAEPSNLPAVVSEWLPSARAQDVAAAGQQLVIAKHSLAARGAQIERCIRAMVTGGYRGSRWVRGEFCIDVVPACVD